MCSEYCVHSGKLKFGNYFRERGLIRRENLTTWEIDQMWSVSWQKQMCWIFSCTLEERSWNIALWQCNYKLLTPVLVCLCVWPWPKIKVTVVIKKQIVCVFVSSHPFQFVYDCSIQRPDHKLKAISNWCLLEEGNLIPSDKNLSRDIYSTF